VTGVKNIGGHLYPPFHPGWGGFAEELFHYTSRYFCATEAFLRNLSQDSSFAMSGYRAARLSTEQRDLMAAVLSCHPDREAGVTLVAMVSAVVQGDRGVQAAWVASYRERLDSVSRKDVPAQRTHLQTDDAAGVSPLDPFLNIAERLQMPVAIREHHVEVPLHALAEYLVSPNSTLRVNLHNAVLQVHNAGYVLRNHPHLTHSEAQAIADEDAV